MSTGQIVGQRVEVKKYHASDSRTGKVCAWMPLNNLRALAVVEMDDGSFELVSTDDLARVHEAPLAISST